MIDRRHQLRLVTQEESSSAMSGASKWQIAKGRLREGLGGVLSRRRLPGVLQPFRFDDPVTGDQIEAVVGRLFTKLSVNGRDYYFDRLTGRFDGTGQGCG